MEYLHLIEHDMFHYCPDDSRREFIKIPLDPTQNSCINFRIFLEKIDNFFGSDNFKETLFGDDANEYQYIPLRLEVFQFVKTKIIL